MTARPADQQKLPKKERKALARELARLERERQARRRRRNRRLGWAGAGTGAVAAGVVAVLLVQASVRAGQVGPLGMLSDGVVLAGDGSTVSPVSTGGIPAGGAPVATAVDRTSGVLDLVLYVDYRSPEAAALWQADGSVLAQWVTAGNATLEVHPLALLDGTTVAAPTSSASPSASASPEPSPSATATTGDYSLRAAGALACVVDGQPDAVLAVHQALLTAQPGLDADGLDDDELVALVQDAGARDDAVADCVRAGDFTDWAREATDRAADSVPFDVGSVTTSPVLLVGGREYTGALDDPAALSAFVTEVAGQLAAAAQASASPSPSPSASPTPSASPAG
ncbi:thioredoxin domain-containing protein [Cellulomonas sp. C5510]|uniref:DsbA family protein n=1 Tax=Cellulomonas sp. C5510 TaxID=2871170 RepID=UPI001C9564DF|nr:thioredoxin domain-containing protein [Cellulomonas sp. C5510]QZN84974.1 DsbA family protein [Cellulomonas sp. C5510]